MKERKGGRRGGMSKQKEEEGKRREGSRSDGIREIKFLGLQFC